jgi:hypothetical protein
MRRDDLREGKFPERSFRRFFMAKSDRTGTPRSFFLLWLFLLTLPTADGWAWINPRQAVDDPGLIRLQQGRKALKDDEKKEIDLYGLTALEAMSYVRLRQVPGVDFDAFYIETSLESTGVVQRWVGNLRWKWYVDDPLARLGIRGIQPGELNLKRITKTLYPSKIRGSTGLNSFFVKTKDLYKRESRHLRQVNLKRIRTSSAAGKSDKFFGLDVTWDDWYIREPWEENQRVLGEDTIRGIPCLVIESKNWFVPDYYLSRRVVWVDRERFLDLHEEQFDRKGFLYKIIDKEWKELDSGHSVWTRWYAVDLSTRTKSMEETSDWRINGNLRDEDFSLRVLESEEIWRDPKTLPPVVQKGSDFPPEPIVRIEFWRRKGEKVDVLQAR